MTETQTPDDVERMLSRVTSPVGRIDALRSELTEAELLRDPQKVLRRLGLPPHTPPELVSSALTEVRLLVGQGIQVQQEALKATPLFAWLDEHAGTRIDASSLVMTLRIVAVR